jgi:hypothetical protein
VARSSWSTPVRRRSTDGSIATDEYTKYLPGHATLPDVTVDRRHLLGVVVVGVLAVIAGCGEPPPAAFCENCTDDFDELRGVDDEVVVEHRELTVTVREDGSSRYVVRSRVDRETLDAASPADRERLRERLRERYAGRNARVELGEDAVVVGYDGPRVGEPGIGGTVVVDYLREPDFMATAWEVKPDRLVVRGPPETVPTRVPEGAVVRDGTLVFEEGDRIDRETLFLFAPDGPVGTAAARVETFETLAAISVGVAFVLGLPSLVVLGPFVVAMGAFATLGRRRLSTLWFWGLVVPATALVLGGVGTTLVATFGSEGAFAVATLLAIRLVPVLGIQVVLGLWLAGRLDAVRGRERVERLLAQGGPLAAVGSVVAGLLLAVYGRIDVASLLWVFVPPGLALAFGYATGTGSRRRWLYPPAILLVPVWMVAPVDHNSPIVVFGWLYTVVGPLIWSGVAVASTVFFVDGYALATGEDPFEVGPLATGRAVLARLRRG